MASISTQNHEKLQKVVIILGTTAVGKTKLSVELAKELSKYLGSDNKNSSDDEHLAEIISADSVQIYKGMEICSDAITPGVFLPDTHPSFSSI